MSASKSPRRPVGSKRDILTENHEIDHVVLAARTTLVNLPRPPTKGRRDRPHAVRRRSSNLPRAGSPTRARASAVSTKARPVSTDGKECETWRRPISRTVSLRRALCMHWRECWDSRLHVFSLLAFRGSCTQVFLLICDCVQIQRLHLRGIT